MGGTYTRGSCLRVVGVWPCYNVLERQAGGTGFGVIHIITCTAGRAGQGVGDRRPRYCIVSAWAPYNVLEEGGEGCGQVLQWIHMLRVRCGVLTRTGEFVTMYYIVATRTVGIA